MRAHFPQLFVRSHKIFLTRPAASQLFLDLLKGIDIVRPCLHLRRYEKDTA